MVKRNLKQMITEFKSYWKHYVFQSCVASITLLIVLIFLKLENVVVVASIGSTLFIIFAMPENITAQPRNVIGGHLVGLIAGGLCGFIPHSQFITAVFIYSLAVGISIFIMVVIDVEHPPASSTALGVAMTGFSWKIILAVITSVVVLSLVHTYCKKYIKNLV